MNIKILIHFNLISDFKLIQTEESIVQKVFMIYRKPRNLTPKPPDKNKKVYLNQASY